MNWKAPLAVVLTGLALVIGTVVTVANGHDGTPAVTVLVSQPGRDTSALPLSAPEGPCALVSTALPGRGAVTVSGACSGTVSGSAVCGDCLLYTSNHEQTAAGSGGR